MDFKKSSSITSEMLIHKPNGIPIVLCSSAPRAMRKLSEAGYISLSLNKEVSSALLKFSVDDRPSKVLDVIQNLLEETAASVIVTDFEMLFDPRYKLDVLKVFCEAARTKNIAVKWCGSVTEDSLCFSEPQYPDYHNYKIERYTLICVK